jgi:hypothetical protein
MIPINLQMQIVISKLMRVIPMTATVIEPSALINPNKVTEYLWDIRDRLTGVTVKDINGDIIKSAEYQYDVYNQRIVKTVDADGSGAAVAKSVENH